MKRNLVITPVPISLIGFMWNKIEPVLRKTLSLVENEHTPDIMKSELMRGNKQLIAVLDEDKVIAVNIVEIITFGTGYKIFLISQVAGTRLKQWSDRFISICHAIALEQGCSEIRGTAMRKGWIRYLDDEWEEQLVLIKCNVRQPKTNIQNIKRRI